MARPAEVAPAAEVLEPHTPPKAGPVRELRGVAAWLDDSVGLAKIGKAGLRKVFPDHWSFLLGEIALYSFIVLLITGIFLTIWFKPSMAEIEYAGTYELMRGRHVSEAFASTLAISFDVRGGLLVRQIHHWAALLFVAALTAHMLRIFFTGAFRRPRQINWLIGVGLMSISLIAGFSGYSLPDDLLSGTGLRFVDGLIRSIPVVGTWLEFFIFDGEFPGEALIPRLYMVHILLIPGLILGLVSAHLALVVYHKHTQFPGPGRTETNVVGYPLFPVYMAKAGGFFFIVFGVLILMGATLSINQVWLYGPYNPAQVTAGSQPDWYMGWVEGALRMVPPGWESHWGPTTWTWAVFLPGVGLMGVLFTALALWPFIEAKLTGDTAEHNLLDRPRNAPSRTALGVAGMACYAMFWLNGANDIIATQFNVSLNAVTNVMRVMIFLAPVLAFIATKRICLSLQRADRDRVLHGAESGVIERAADGNYTEGHAPIGEAEAFTLTQHRQYEPRHEALTEDEHGVRVKDASGVSPLWARLSRWWVGDDISRPTALEIEQARHHAVDDEDAPRQLT